MTSSSSVAARPATRRRSAPRSSAARSCASSASPRSAARASGSAASRRRPGCRPRTPSTRRARSIGKLGVVTAEPTLDFATGDRVEGRRRQADDGRRRARSSRRTVSSGCRVTGASPTRTRSRSRGGEDVTFRERDRRHRLVPDAPADPGPRLAALRRLDRAARPDRGAAPARRPRRRDHRLRVRLDLRPLRHRGDDRRDARPAHPAGGRGRDEGARRRRSSSAASRSSSASSARRSTTRARGSSSTSARARRSSAT